MQCPYCRKDNDRVVDSRVIEIGTAIRRRRECLECRKRFTTYERIEAVQRWVRKKSDDDRREAFCREKILAGMQRACEKRGIPEGTLQALADRIEAELFEEHDGDLSSRAIGEKVSGYLRELDPVAFVRFASVYNEYQDAEQFLAAVDGLRPPTNGSARPSARAAVSVHADGERRSESTGDRLALSSKD